MPRKPRPCAVCPKREWNGVCVIKGKYVVPNHPSCAYGRKLMNNERSAEAMRRKHGYKKRPPKPLPQEDEEE